MAALTDNRIRNSYCTGNYGELPVAVDGGVHIYKGAMVCVSLGTGLLKPVGAGTDLVCLGVAKYEVDASSASDGALFGAALPGRWGGFNSGTSSDALTSADIGREVYGIDDNTVGKTSGSDTRSIVGTLVGFDDRGKLILSLGAGL